MEKSEIRNPKAESQKRVVVTGLGTISPCGHDVAATWESVVHGRSGVARIARFPTGDLKVKIAAEVKDFDPAQYMSVKDARRRDRFCQFAVIASLEAVRHARFQVDESNADHVGVFMGTAVGGLNSYYEVCSTHIQHGPGRVSPLTIPLIIGDSASGHVALELGARGPNVAPVSACSAGADAIGLAYRAILHGDALAMVAGGAEATISPIGMAAFDALRAMSRRNDDPPGASRPFAADRDGLVMGEGAAALVLERLDAAEARGAQPLAEITGYASTDDAYHITAPAPNGESASLAVRRALHSAGLSAEEVDHINAHGTATQFNDAIETNVIKAVFGPRAYQIPISATKSMTGHMMGATGALEAIFCVLALQEELLPPTINLHLPDPACDLDYVPNTARRQAIRTALSHSFGFGGHNTVLVLKRFEG
ncbi:MAG: beta-ketoacyl-ACP synthase II [Thermoflexales bacterium]|nr:beta-ketoacyl-ACP synthase II [Thermoflexales bacterium]